MIVLVSVTDTTIQIQKIDYQSSSILHPLHYHDLRKWHLNSYAKIVLIEPTVFGIQCNTQDRFKSIFLILEFSRSYYYWKILEMFWNLQWYDSCWFFKELKKIYHCDTLLNLDSLFYYEVKYLWYRELFEKFKWKVRFWIWYFEIFCFFFSNIYIYIYIYYGYFGNRLLRLLMKNLEKMIIVTRFTILTIVNFLLNFYRDTESYVIFMISSSWLKSKRDRKSYNKCKN